MIHHKKKQNAAELIIIIIQLFLKMQYCANILGHSWFFFLIFLTYYIRTAGNTKNWFLGCHPFITILPDQVFWGLWKDQIWHPDEAASQVLIGLLLLSELTNSGKHQIWCIKNNEANNQWALEILKHYVAFFFSLHWARLEAFPIPLVMLSWHSTAHSFTFTVQIWACGGRLTTFKLIQQGSDATAFSVYSGSLFHFLFHIPQIKAIKKKLCQHWIQEWNILDTHFKYGIKKLRFV